MVSFTVKEPLPASSWSGVTHAEVIAPSSPFAFMYSPGFQIFSSMRTT